MSMRVVVIHSSHRAGLLSFFLLFGNQDWIIDDEF